MGTCSFSRLVSGDRAGKRLIANSRFTFMDVSGRVSEKAIIDRFADIPILFL